MKLGRSLFLPLILLLLPSGDCLAQSRPLRVMSFNIRYDEPRDKENAWPNRKEMVASTVRFHRADLVGVQEALKHQLQDLEQLLPEFAWLGVGRDDGRETGEFSAILYRKDRLNPLRHSTFWLSEKPGEPGSKGWDAAYPRIVTWARFRDRLTGQTFYHLNTHFDHRGSMAREQSARLLLAQIDKIAGSAPVLVTGDFNFNETSAGYKLLVGKSGLKDARYTSQYPHHGPTSTFNEFKALVRDWRIDYVMVKGSVKVVHHGILADTWDGRFPSDHLPVLAEVLIGEGSR